MLSAHGLHLWHPYEASMPLWHELQMSLLLCPPWVTLFQRVQWPLSRKSLVR